MMLSHYTLECPIVFNEEEVNYLIVEDQRQMTRYIVDMISGIENRKCDFILSEGNAIFELEKNAEMIIDPFRLDPNNVRTVNDLLQKMRSYALSDNQLKTDEMISVINSTMGEILREQHPSVEFSENLDIVKLFKFLGIRFNHSYENINESLCEYILIKRDHSYVKLFVFLNLRSLLTEEELNEFYRFLMYNKISVLLIENRYFEPKPPEKVRLIDKDLCEIGEQTQFF